MKLTVFGATGGVGREVVRQALEAGHEVTAVVRDPARLGVPEHQRLHVAVVADLTDPDALVPVLTGREAVISALGSANNKQARLSPVTSPAVRSILVAMDLAGVSRLSAVSAAPVGPDVPGDGVVARKIFLPLLRRVLRDLYADLAVMEALIRASRTQWTVIRPPKLLNKPRTGTYRRAIDANVPAGRFIARADVADALLTSLSDPSTTGHAVGVAA
ncbi:MULTISPECIES: NAD(P)-dependent oxidoreductase [unclassified Streptomyces]|uniref:NAD(P)-dependent oxidoreductase n=1 Tax=unclassified Streptomyces TaxID=2593676 RepID=UPI001BE739CF|nr:MULTISPECIES: NAD(P)H-binding protein [unclassified Streptomyces]MBT2402272.1 NAD(P)H-binding protein [Streptomyces sp. ISL-21]MBT2456385.1 NAD(P)H-binding protein [Streptomyces sp. ISL-86]MBT2606781.1 NAD(P)H-binding protein [Streptomyces sp. ISL-87]